MIEGCHFISGPQVEELEKALCAYTGRKYCVTVSSGTDALLMPLMAWGIHEGDAVFVPGFTFFATAEVVSLTGATPVFCDINPYTFNMDPNSLSEQIERVLREGKLTPKAVIPVDLFGQPAEFPKIEEICQEHHLLVMEDAAQGFGGAIDGKRACCFGDVSATSFFRPRCWAAMATAERSLPTMKRCTKSWFPSASMERAPTNMKMCASD